MSPRLSLIAREPCTSANRQRGTVLVVALVLLLVLTLLGVTAMNTTTLEERMAFNSQEINRAFQAAETGLDAGFANPGAFSLTDVFEGNTGLMGDYEAGANYAVDFLQATNPPVGSLYSATSFSSYHFNIQADAHSRMSDPGGDLLTPQANAARVVLNRGVYQIGPKAN